MIGPPEARVEKGAPKAVSDQMPKLSSTNARADKTYGINNANGKRSTSMQRYTT